MARRNDETSSTARDAIALLTDDHQEVRQLFEQYRDLAEDTSADDEAKRILAEEICTMLTVHATIEEELFYPAARDALDDDTLLNEAEVEHQTAKDLIAQIQEADEIDDKTEAKVKVLGEYIDHHVKEERGEMFPKARAARKLDLVAMRDELMARKEELMAELA